MTIRYSTALGNALAGRQASPVAMVGGIDIALVNAAPGAADTITRVAADFVTKGFQEGDFIYVRGAADANDDIDGIACTIVAAGTITLPTGTFTTGEIAVNDLAVCACRGGSLRDLFHDGIIALYTGAQPSSADDAESGTLIGYITKSGAAFVAGVSTNGLEFTTVVADESNEWSELAKVPADTWQEGAALAAGTIGWARLYTNAFSTGADSSPWTKLRMDFSIAEAGGDYNLSSVVVALGAPITFSTFQLNLPWAR